LMGSTLVAFVRGEYPSLAPKRILDEGCTLGHPTVPLVRYFPRAEVHTIGVGAPILRYAHARAESMGVAIHFSLQSAERTDFPDNHFDLVVSHIMLHETSAKAVPTIMRECHRILRPGGVMAHMDVPVRYRDLPIYDQVIRSWQTYYNDQPFWDAVCSMDLEAAARQGGFKKIKAGYLRASSDPIKEPRTLSPTGDQGPAWRYIVSAVK
ncbi:MAG: class I SAM-dependent methyltransferase, partial [Alphaproteobacteria bacterium]|nr:class I SAM-dependent methyltransferase [Alphaproteobacteria bacterium]